MLLLSPSILCTISESAVAEVGSSMQAFAYLPLLRILRNYFISPIMLKDMVLMIGKL
jgi:hypothetical protein